MRDDIQIYDGFMFFDDRDYVGYDPDAEGYFCRRRDYTYPGTGDRTQVYELEMEDCYA